MADVNKTIALVGVLGVGGYIAYEYFRYSSAMSIAAGGNATQIANGEAILPFFTFLMMNFSPTAGNAQQQQAYQVLQAILSGQTPQPTPQPGTTSTSQPTSVSNAPPTTPAPLPPAPATPNLAASMQNAINMTTATADQWNYAYNQLMGKGADAQYNFNFDKVFGPVVNGTRWSGTMSAAAFLQMAQSGTGMSGLAVIADYPGPRYSTVGSMAYLLHHPFPYMPTYTLKGLRGLTMATGFEKALLAGQPLRSNKIR